MMELRVLDKKAFIAFKNGKHEVVKPPEQVIAGAQKEIANARAIVADLRDKEQATQQRLESALLALESTRQHRVDLAAILEEIKDHERDAAQARALITEVDALVDEHTAAAIRQEDAARLAAVLKPFVDFQKGSKPCHRLNYLPV